MGIRRRVKRLDAWQVLFALLMMSLIGATSTRWAGPAAGAPRFVIGSALLAYTLLRYPPQSAPSRLVRTLAPLGMFVLWAVGSLAWTRYPGVVASQLLGAAVTLGVVVAASVGRWRKPSLLMGDLLVLWWVIAIASVAGMVFGSPTSSRFSGVYNNPNTYAMMGCLVVGLGLGVVVVARRPVVVQAVIAITLFGMLLSQGRAGLGAIAAVGTLVLFQRGRTRRKLLAFIAAGVALASGWALIGLSAPSQVSTVLERFQDDDPLNNRGAGWRLGVDLWQEAPIAGHGFRTGEEALNASRSGGMISTFDSDLVHNGALQVLIEVGIVGAVLLALVLLPALRFRPPDSDPLRSLYRGAYLAVVAGLVIQLAESSLLGVGGPFALTFWTCHLASVRLSREARARRAQRAFT